ncbi:MAG: hypothetical protein MJZ34_10630 [Paludibacteraceae bacterium]|nr:hypothetical protein [Paludibacteraceae bacterium]
MAAKNKNTENVVEKVVETTEKPKAKKATKAKKLTEQETINYLLGDVKEMNLETIKKSMDDNFNNCNDNFATCLATAQANGIDLENIKTIVTENAKDIKKNYKMIFVTMIIMMILVGSQFGMVLALTLGAK